jgi:hypothetical protein
MFQPPGKFIDNLVLKPAGLAIQQHIPSGSVMQAAVIVWTTVVAKYVRGFTFFTDLKIDRSGFHGIPLCASLFIGGGFSLLPNCRPKAQPMPGVALPAEMLEV